MTRKFIFLLAACVAISPSFATLAQDGRTIERSMNKETAQWQQFFQNALISLSIDDKGAHFKSRPYGPKFRVETSEANTKTDWDFDFTLSKPGERFSSPDKHSSRVFTVKEITKNTITLSYESISNYSDFGKNLITQDSGEITLHPFTNDDSK